MVTLGVAGTFLGIAIVFGALAYFQTPNSGGTQKVSVPVTNEITVTPPIASSPAGATGPAPNASVVVTVTSTKVVSVQASDGSSLAAIETGASTLATVVAAGCAVIALRPQGRGRPPAPPAPAAAADAPASAPGA